MDDGKGRDWVSGKKKKSIREEQKHPQTSKEQSGGHLLPWDFLITGLGEKIQDGELQDAEVLSGQGEKVFLKYCYSR